MSRKKAKRLEGRFAAIPLEVMQSPAWRSLPHGARSVLQVLAVQYNGHANGVQNLARATCRRYGLAHSRALKHAQTLEDRGLIVKTYTAKYTASRSRIPSQWAIGWRDITHADNHELGTIRKAKNEWVIWRPANFQSGRNGRNKSKTAANLSAIPFSYCGRYETEIQFTAAETSNLLRVWGSPLCLRLPRGIDYARYAIGAEFGQHPLGERLKARACLQVTA